MNLYYAGYGLSAIVGAVGLVFAVAALATGKPDAPLYFGATAVGLLFLSGHVLVRLIGHREVGQLPLTLATLEERVSSLKRVGILFQGAEHKLAESAHALEETRRLFSDELTMAAQAQAELRTHKQLLAQAREQVDSLLDEWCRLRTTCWNQAADFPAVGNLGQTIDQVLSAHGISVIAPGSGEPLNAESMKVESRVSSANIPEGRVVTCLTPGYRLPDGSLVPAEVVLADGVVPTTNKDAGATASETARESE